MAVVKKNSRKDGEPVKVEPLANPTPGPIKPVKAGVGGRYIEVGGGVRVPASD